MNNLKYISKINDRKANLSRKINYLNKLSKINIEKSPLVNYYKNLEKAKDIIEREVLFMGKKNNKKKHINHNPRVESAKATFGEPKAHDDEFTPHLFKQNSKY